MVEKIKSKEFLISLMLIFIIIGIIVLKDENKLVIIKKDFQSPLFIGFFMVIVGVSIIGLLSSNNRLKTSVRHAIIAFLIAYFAHLDAVFGSFFIVGAFVYFTEQSNSTIGL